MNTWKALFNLDGQEQVVKRAYGPSFGLAGPVHHVDCCSCQAVSEIEQWQGESSGFFRLTTHNQLQASYSLRGTLSSYSATEPFSVVRCPRVRKTEGSKSIRRENQEGKL